MNKGGLRVLPHLQFSPRKDWLLELVRRADSKVLTAWDYPSYRESICL